MAICEMCGKSAELFHAEVEGVELSVCSLCSRHGIMKKDAFSPKAYPKAYDFPPRSGLPEWKVTGNFAQILKSAREMRNLIREDFAKILNERESVVAKWEQGALKPTIDAAKKLEKKLGISLLEKDETSAEKIEKKSDSTLTLGDIIAVKKRGISANFAKR